MVSSAPILANVVGEKIPESVGRVRCVSGSWNVTRIAKLI